MINYNLKRNELLYIMARTDELKAIITTWVVFGRNYLFL